MATLFLFVSHSDIFHHLLFRAIFPRLRPRMIRYMNIYPAEAEAARQETISAMDRIGRELQPSGYLVGNRFTVTDLTAAALLWPLVMPKEFPYKLPTKLPAPFAKEREQLAGHRAVTWAAGIYRNHRGRSAAISDETVI